MIPRVPPCLRVVVLEEPCGEGQTCWVAQALDQDLAAQTSPGSPPLAAVEALGALFDARDAIVAKYAADNIAMNPPAAAPASYHGFWTDGEPLGTHPLGASRSAEVRRRAA